MVGGVERREPVVLSAWAGRETLSCPTPLSGPRHSFPQLPEVLADGPQLGPLQGNTPSLEGSLHPQTRQ